MDPQHCKTGSIWIRSTVKLGYNFSKDYLLWEQIFFLLYHENLGQFCSTYSLNNWEILWDCLFKNREVYNTCMYILRGIYTMFLYWMCSSTIIRMLMCRIDYPLPYSTQCMYNRRGSKCILHILLSRVDWIFLDRSEQVKYPKVRYDFRSPNPKFWHAKGVFF